MELPETKMEKESQEELDGGGGEVLAVSPEHLELGVPMRRPHREASWEQSAGEGSAGQGVQHQRTDTLWRVRCGHKNERGGAVLRLSPGVSAVWGPTGGEGPGGQSTRYSTSPPQGLTITQYPGASWVAGGEW